MLASLLMTTAICLHADPPAVRDDTPPAVAVKIGDGKVGYADLYERVRRGETVRVASRVVPVPSLFVACDLPDGRVGMYECSLADGRPTMREILFPLVPAAAWAVRPVHSPSPQGAVPCRT